MEVRLTEPLHDRLGTFALERRVDRVMCPDRVEHLGYRPAFDDGYAVLRHLTRDEFLQQPVRRAPRLNRILACLDASRRARGARSEAEIQRAVDQSAPGQLVRDAVYGGTRLNYEGARRVRVLMHGPMQKLEIIGGDHADRYGRQ